MSTSEDTSSNRLRYLTDVLAYDPATHADQILQLRRNYHGLTANAPTPADAVTEVVRTQRSQTLADVERLRENFWTMTTEELTTALAQIDATPFPDLQRVVERLTLLARHRPAMARLPGLKGFNEPLFSALKRILVSPGRVAEGIRLRHQREMEEELEWGATQRMIRVLQREVPEIYALEKLWLERLYRSHITAYQIGFALRSSPATPGLLWGLLVILVCVLTYMALSYLGLGRGS